MKFIIELLRFVYNRKKYWIVPILVILLILGGLIVISGLYLVILAEESN